MTFIFKGHEASELVFCPGLTTYYYILGKRFGGDLREKKDWLPNFGWLVGWLVFFGCFCGFFDVQIKYLFDYTET